MKIVIPETITYICDYCKSESSTNHLYNISGTNEFIKQDTLTPQVITFKSINSNMDICSNCIDLLQESFYKLINNFKGVTHESEE